MEAPLLQAKLYVPPARPEWVSRPRLVERLNAGLDRKLTLISAPAGFGKTTLLSEWAAGCGQPVAWLSLDGGDNDPARFWAYFVAALQAIPGLREVGVGGTAWTMLRSPQPPSIEAVLTALINETAAIPAAFILVLDDYHQIQARPIHDALTFLLDHMPPPMHLALATRVDPPLPIARLRGRGQLIELRQTDLRFTSDEAAAFLNQVMDLDLSAEQVAALERRTEGWITGLQLAALSMRGHDDVSGFVQAFAGSHRYVLDFLAEEVLHRQPQDVQTFLLRTSILERLTAPLCDAVTGQEDSLETLETLEQANLFIVPLDDERRWYRYHHLFAQVLRAFLQRAAGVEGVASLHLQAAQWYEAHGEVNQAFKHALAAQDFERAARLIEENWLRVGHAGQMNTILRWLASLPEAIVRARPLLSLAYAWALWLTGQMEAVEPHLDAAAAGWDRPEAAGEAGPGSAPWRAGGVALRLQLARDRGQLQEAVHLARQTLALADPDDALLHGYGHLGLASAHRDLGNYEQSRSACVRGMALMRAAGNLSSANLTAFYLYRLLQLQGRLRQAAQVVQEAMQFAHARGEAESPAYGILHVALAGLLCERGKLREAEDHLLRGLEMSRLGGHHDYLRNGAIVLARLRLAQRDPAGALEAIQEAEQLAPRGEMPLPRAELAAYKARVWIAQGNLAAAARWAEDAARRPGQDRGYTRQIEALTRARVLVARGDLDQALDQLASCRQRARESGARGWDIEIGVLTALVQDALGHRAEALAELGRALARAEPEGYVQLFADEGAPMAALLTAFLGAQSIGRPSDSVAVSRRYVRRLLHALGAAAAEQAPGTEPRPSPLIEPLTPRETEVLRLMAAGLSNRQIAEELIVAIGTVKAHLHHIYGKLGVRSRTEAAARARELHLL
jgi:LuxR family maltose regulon positive regulatory protein